ncbi:MAG: chromate transporter, partial [Clostridia bacterium]|nr:chromate transporter [Clostridia bacterium]
MIYLTLFLEFFKMGLFTFGGGYAMIPLIEETVLKYGWLTEERFSEMLGVCESTPGPVAINMATYIGSVQGGFLGSLVATIGVVLPS